jgi:hypothetical protein
LSRVFYGPLRFYGYHPAFFVPKMKDTVTTLKFGLNIACAATISPRDGKIRQPDWNGPASRIIQVGFIFF